MKYGLEVEFFATAKDGGFIDASMHGLPHDDWPMIVEARGQPFDCPFHAVGNVRAEIARIVNVMRVKELAPAFEDWVSKEAVKELEEAILRRGVNKVIRQENMHNLPPSKKNKTHYSAGLHVSITNPTTYYVTTGKGDRTTQTESIRNAMFDYAKIFRAISKEFDKDIKKSGRTPGFYELKSDGRVEYRSLPATIIHEKDFDSRLASCMV